MDWTAIILGLFSGTTVLGVVEAIRYRRENKKIKSSEATMSDVEAQKAQMELANLYKQNMLEMMEQFKLNGDNQALMIEKLDRLDERMEKLEIKVGDIEEYLNGPYHEHLAHKKSDGGKNKR